MLTDCDLNMAVLANELDPATLTVGDIMATEPFTVQEEVSVIAVLRFVRERGCAS